MIFHVRLEDFDYELPPELIAQCPAHERDASRLLVLDRTTGDLRHRSFPSLLDHLRPGDLLVFNNSRVIPARLRARNAVSSGHFEVLLLEEVAADEWWVMMRPGKRARIGTKLEFLTETSPSGVSAVVVGMNDQGHRRIRFQGVGSGLELAEAIGEVPLPPYIRREPGRTRPEDRDRYQTIFAQAPGSVAAPTAGLHFTRELLTRVHECHIKTCWVTLHVGPGTFAPVKSDDLNDHVMHEERYDISPEAAAAIASARNTGGRIIAVGTTALRVLETAAAARPLDDLAGPGRTRLFVKPPYTFRLADGLLTNFHLPRSTLLMLVSAFASPADVLGIQMIQNAYREAVRLRYRFFSYGDAMLIV